MPPLTRARASGRRPGTSLPNLPPGVSTIGAPSCGPSSSYTTRPRCRAIVWLVSVLTGAVRGSVGPNRSARDRFHPIRTAFRLGLGLPAAERRALSVVTRQ